MGERVVFVLKSGLLAASVDRTTMLPAAEATSGKARPAAAAEAGRTMLAQSLPQAKTAREALGQLHVVSA